MYAIIQQDETTLERRCIARYETKGEANRALRALWRAAGSPLPAPRLAQEDFEEGYTLSARDARLTWEDRPLRLWVQRKG